MTNEHIESFMRMTIKNKILVKLVNNIIINAVDDISKLYLPII